MIGILIYQVVIKNIASPILESTSYCRKLEAEKQKNSVNLGVFSTLPTQWRTAYADWHTSSGW